MAHSLRLKVVAEGVETEEQARTLRSLRCDQMQGFLFSKPLPRERDDRAPGARRARRLGVELGIVPPGHLAAEHGGVACEQGLFVRGVIREQRDADARADADLAPDRPPASACGRESAPPRLWR